MKFTSDPITTSERKKEHMTILDAIETETWHDQQPTHPSEHQLVTRARHTFENREQEYENAYSNWEQGLATGVELFCAQQLMLQAEQNLRDVRKLVMDMETIK